MRSMRRGVAAAAVLTAALGAAALATAALSTRSDTVSVAPNTAGVATAKCPRGSEVVSQGFKAKDFDSDYGAPGSDSRTVFPSASRRTGSRRAKASGLSLGTEPARLAAYAYCAEPKPGLSIVKSEPAPVAPHALEVARARCPRGSEVVGGGSRIVDFNATGGPRVYTIGSRRISRRAWQVTGAEITNTPGGAIASIAYCDDSKPGLGAVSSRVTVPGTYGAQATTTARCASGDVPRSGGFQIVDFDPTYVTDATPYPLASKRSGRRGWTARAHQDNGEGYTSELIAYVYCAG